MSQSIPRKKYPTGENEGQTLKCITTSPKITRWQPVRFITLRAWVKVAPPSPACEASSYFLSGNSILGPDPDGDPLLIFFLEAPPPHQLLHPSMGLEVPFPTPRNTTLPDNLTLPHCRLSATLSPLAQPANLLYIESRPSLAPPELPSLPLPASEVPSFAPAWREGPRTGFGSNSNL